MGTQKAKVQWKLWIAILVFVVIAVYYCQSLFCYPNVTLNNFQDLILESIKNPLPPLKYMNDFTPIIILIAIGVWGVAFIYYISSRKNFRFGKEYGSAQWGSWQEINRKFADYKDSKKKVLSSNNRVLSENLRFSYDTRKTRINNHQLVIGGSGAGKTAFVMSPNLLQFHGSNIYTDPKGGLLEDFGNILEEEGVVVKSINLCNMDQSMQYNPFDYIHSQKELQALITNIISNTTPAGSGGGSDPFWEKSETLYLMGIFAYVWLECPRVAPKEYIRVDMKAAREAEYAANYIAEHKDDLKSDGTPVYPFKENDISLQKTAQSQARMQGFSREEAYIPDPEAGTIKLEKNFRTVLHLLSEAEVKGQRGEEKSTLTCRFDELAADPDNPLGKEHPACDSYYKCIRGAGDTVRSIIISANARFAPFQNEDLLRILDDDELQIEDIAIGKDGDGKTRTALFCIIPDEDSTFNFVIGMLYTQVFQEFYRIARLYDGALPLDVGFWFDEFANIAMPRDFRKILATARSRNIYITIVLQNLADLKTLYDKNEWEGIVGNCDTMIYLGGNEQGTHEYISKKLGKETIDKRSTGQSYGSHGSSSKNEDILGRELMTPDEVGNMDNNYSIVFIRGERPVYDHKYPTFTSEGYKRAKSLGKYEYHPIIQTDPATGRKETFSLKPAFQKLSDESFELYKKKAEAGENVQILAPITMEAFCNLDFGEEPEEITLEQLEEVQRKVEKIAEEEAARQEEEQIPATAEENVSYESIDDMLDHMETDVLISVADLIGKVPDEVILKHFTKNMDAARAKVRAKQLLTQY